MSTSIRIGLIGFGQIAKVQHLPVLTASPDFTLAALVNPSPIADAHGIACFDSLDALIAAGIVDAVALCTPPQVRYRLARQALDAGLHVLLEKPPAQTTAELDDLAAHASAKGRSLFTAWHSMFAPAVPTARAVLAERGVVGMDIDWREDVHKFHPGVDWFWQPGGMGVFDPGINALSIAVACLPEPLFVRAARFRVRPGQHTPVTATLAFATPSHEIGFSAFFDWDHAGMEGWTIDWTLGDGTILKLEQGGKRLSHDGVVLVDATDNEYAALYAHFARLIAAGRSDVESRPLRLAADAYGLASREGQGAALDPFKAKP